MRSKHQGMTLIEIIVVVAIVGILAALAFPSYQDRVRESRRSDGMTSITQVMQAQERFFVNNFTYTTDLTDLGFGDAGSIPSQEGYYQISAATCGGGVAITSCVSITAAAQNDQVNDNGGAADLTLNTLGEKGGPW